MKGNEYNIMKNLADNTLDVQVEEVSLICRPKFLWKGLLRFIKVWLPQGILKEASTQAMLTVHCSRSWWWFGAGKEEAVASAEKIYFICMNEFLMKIFESSLVRLIGRWRTELRDGQDSLRFRWILTREAVWRIWFKHQDRNIILSNLNAKLMQNKKICALWRFLCFDTLPLWMAGGGKGMEKLYARNDSPQCGIYPSFKWQRDKNCQISLN